MTKRVGRRLRPIRASRQAELWYLNRLLDGVEDMRRRARAVLRAALTPLATPGQARDADPWANALDALSRDREFNSLKGQAGLLARLAAQRSRRWVDDKLTKEVHRALGVDVRAALQSHGPAADRLREFTTWNVNLITSLPDRFKADLQDTLTTAWASGLRVTEIESLVDDAVTAAGESCEANAARIARDQTSKMNAAFTRVRHEELGIRKYQWRTSDDERVRDDHAAMETGGENGDGVYEWDAPGPLISRAFGNPCHPGDDIECRCDAIPVFDLDEMEASWR